MFPAIPMIAAFALALVALVGCDRPAQSSPAHAFHLYESEDACEDAGQSDAFCDAMFPELEDFLPSKAMPKTKPAKVIKPVYKPSEGQRPKVINPVYQTTKPVVKAYKEQLQKASVTKSPTPAPRSFSAPRSAPSTTPSTVRR